MQRKRVRPDPVSCQTCRSKKLKCNRVKPCSNCTARGIACNFLVPPQELTDANSTFHSNPEILERIERLESILLNQTDRAQNFPKYASDDSYVPRQQSGSPISASVVVSNIHQERDQDSNLLENIGTTDDMLPPHLSNGLVFRISSTHEILRTKTSLQHPTSVLNNDRLNKIAVTIPVYRIAALLFQSYESNMDHLCQILHIPTVWSLIKTFYLRISQSESVSPGQAALLLSIFAIGAYVYQPLENSEVVTTKQDAIHLSKILSRGALDILDYSRRNTLGTLEDIQANILMSFIAYHLDGSSTRGRILTTAAASIARELRLHQLDAENESSAINNETSFRILIDREVKRRVFWNIASTDWLLSTVSGPQEGTYFIHPNQFNVKPPTDFAGDDIAVGEESGPTNRLQPTGMTFFLERLKLAHLCREMTDTVPLDTSKLIQMPYEQIIALDKKLQNFISNLPFFFKLDVESRRRSKPLETMYPNIPISRYFITTEAHSRRCKLHQRFLHRQSINSRYVYSRRACLESARAVIHVYKDLREQDSLSSVTALVGMVVHFTNIALVVIIMDLCFNKDEADEAETKAEATAALQMFEDASNVSLLQDRFLSSLRDVLRKYKAHLNGPSALATDNFAGFAYESMLTASNNHFNDDQLQLFQPGLDMQDPSLALNTSFDEFWRIAMHEEPNPDSITWDNLFSALDSRPL